MSKRKKQQKAKPRKVEPAEHHHGFTVKFRHLEGGDAQAGLFLDEEPEPELTIGVIGPLDQERKDRIATAMLELLGLCLGETCCHMIVHEGHGAAAGLH